MLKYISKFVLEILPSVVATIVGAYIVNYYIIPKAVADRPASALASTSDSKAVDKDSLTRDVSIKDSSIKASSINAAPSKVERVDVTPTNAAPDVANDTSAAKAGTKAAIEKANSEKANVEKAVADGANASARRHQPALREKIATKPQPAAIATASVVPSNETAPATIAPAITAPATEERRDANDLARAAIERLRVTNETQPRVQESSRMPEPARGPDAPRVVSAPVVQPLPPAIMVSTPSIETFNTASSASAMKPPDAPIDGAQRPRPPGEIPTASRPLDLRAEATGSTSRDSRRDAANDRTTVADDVLSAAKSVFHAVLPK